jgi:archaellum component FlaC
MYRICRFFISDIVAGDNLLQDGFFPVFRETETPDHGVLFAANGSCKTTLLSFLLSIFCPDQRRFVQHLQSGGDKSLEQYLIPGRPAIVLADLVADGEPTLFDANPMEHLVVGQILYRYKASTDRPDRIFFILKDPENWDAVRLRWRKLLIKPQPYTAVKDFLLPRIQQTTSQKEWVDTLERIGLDPWLISRQVDFARSEGGIKDAFRFRQEMDFLSFFLNCVADMTAAEKLRANLDQSLNKMRNRPRKHAQLKAAQTLKQRMGGFDIHARDWRDIQYDRKKYGQLLGEAAHLLQAALKTSRDKNDMAERAYRDASEERDRLRRRRQLAVANQKWIETREVELQIAEFSRDIDEAAQGAEHTEREIHSIKAADFISETRKVEEQVRMLENSLTEKNEALVPIREAANHRAAQYHVRLDHERQRLTGGVTQSQKEMAANREEQTALGQRIRDLEELFSKAEKTMAALASRIASANGAMGATELLPGEDISDAKARLDGKLADIQLELETCVKEREGLKEQLQGIEQRWKFLFAQASDLKGDLKGAIQARETEAAQRKVLLEDVELKTIAGSDSFEPTRAELSSQVDDAIARLNQKLDTLRMESATLKAEAAHLARGDTPAVGSQVRKLLDHLRRQGIGEGQIRAYPNYLAALCDHPREIAVFMARDPGRFTGIMAVTDDVVQQVKNIPPPDWLTHPVVISLPAPIDAVKKVEYESVSPADPAVYTKAHAKKMRQSIQDQLSVLEGKATDLSARIRFMEISGHRLRAYQKQYPDRSVVDAIHTRVASVKQDIAQTDKDFTALEAQKNELGSRNDELDRRTRALERSRIHWRELAKRIQAWLTQYSELDSWIKQSGETDQQRVAIQAEINRTEAKVEGLKDQLADLRVRSERLQTQREGLDSKADDVPMVAHQILSEEEKNQALIMDIQSLKELYLECADLRRRQATDLGIDSLQKELDDKRKEHGRLKTALQNHREAKSYDHGLAEKWASRGAQERKTGRGELTKALESYQKSETHAREAILFRKKERDRLAKELSQMAANGLQPKVTDQDLQNKDLESQIRKWELEADGLAKSLAKLDQRLPGLETDRDRCRNWYHRLEKAEAAVSTVTPVWDDASPRHSWPQLSHGDDLIESTKRFLIMMEKIRDSELEAAKKEETIRRKMDSAYNALQNALLDEHLKSQLPAVIDELRRHDAESLGRQSRDLMQRCDTIIHNIESDLKRSQQLVDSLIDMLLQYAGDYHQKLQAAGREKIPDNVFIYGGKALLRPGTRLDFTRYRDVFRKSMENWLNELIQDNRVPEVNQKTGNSLGAELLYRLLHAVNGKNEFGIRLLKCDDTGKNYEPVGKDLGSGGEALTTAVLLYALLVSMRRRRYHRKFDRLPAFLILDNPIGVCNRSDFLDAQLKVAGALGIQCVYLTGINDTESLNLFEHRVAIRKSRRHLEINGTAYELLEVIEQNVEKDRGTGTA